MKTVLTKHQVKTFGPKAYQEHGETYRITVTARYDDCCGNEHNSFGLTADIRTVSGRDVAGGCCHDEIAKHFPELAKFIKWHLCSSDGPMHYIANTVYHALEHGPKMAWVYWEDMPAVARHCVKYCSIAEAKDITCDKRGYSIEIDEKTAKVRNLDYARSIAIWPDATDEDLTAPGLRARLEARLPKLLEDFQTAMEELGFTF